MFSLRRLAWPAAYFALIPFINWSFTWAPTVGLPGGGEWTPLTIATGLVLVFRDFAQRAIGHWVFAPLLAGLATTASMDGLAPIAIASGAAFLISEIADWAVFTFTRKPLHERIVLSSLVGAPIDSAVFLFGASFVVPGLFNVWTVAASVAGKLVAAIFIAELIRRRLNAKEPA